MVYTTCVVFGCRSTSYKNKDLRFFRIPSAEERRRLWIQVCKRPDLKDKDDKTLNYKHVCSLHFEKSMYSKKNLKKSALPTLHISPPMYSKQTQTASETEVHNTYIREENQKKLAPENVDIKVEFDPEDDEVDEERQSLRNEDKQTFYIKMENYLKDELSGESSSTSYNDNFNRTKTCMTAQTSEKYQRLAPHSPKLRCQNGYFDEEEITPHQFKLACDKFLSPQVSTLVKAQLESEENPENLEYSHDFKIFCLNLYGSDPNAYKALANIFNFPSEDTFSKLCISSSINK